MTQLMNLEAILGAFIMGILFGTMPRLPEDVIHKQESMALGIFAPIFFTVAGLKVNIMYLLDPKLLVITLVVIAFALFGKVIGTYSDDNIFRHIYHLYNISFGSGFNSK